MEKPADAEREVPIQVMVPPAVHKQVALMSVHQRREHAYRGSAWLTATPPAYASSGPSSPPLRRSAP